MDGLSSQTLILDYLGMEDRRITVRELVNEIGVSIGSVHSILTEDLGIRRVSAKFIPKLLTMEQKQRRLEITQDIPVVRQAPYSPNMAPCDFWLFPKLKMPLKGTRFESREDILRNATAWLITIPKDAFQKCFQQGGSAGRSVCITKETTLKGIRVLYL
jgi:hypothetical protein